MRICRSQLWLLAEKACKSDHGGYCVSLNMFGVSYAAHTQDHLLCSRDVSPENVALYHAHPGG